MLKDLVQTKANALATQQSFKHKVPLNVLVVEMEDDEIEAFMAGGFVQAFEGTNPWGAQCCWTNAYVRVTVAR